MKKVFALLLTMVIALSACGNDTQPKSETQPELTEDEIDLAVNGDTSFVGRSVTVAAGGSGVYWDNPDYYAYSVYTDPDNYAGDIIVVFSKSLGEPESEYNIYTGTIISQDEFSNLIGMPTSSMIVMVSSIEPSNYIDVVAPTTKEVTVDKTQEQYGYAITVDKVEFSDIETRIYLTVENNGAGEFSLYDFNCVITQGNTQFETQSNYSADYDEIPSDLRPGMVSSGIITFPVIEQSDFSLFVDAYSNDCSEHLEEYSFDITVS